MRCLVIAALAASVTPALAGSVQIDFDGSDEPNLPWGTLLDNQYDIDPFYLDFNGTARIRGGDPEAQVKGNFLSNSEIRMTTRSGYAMSNIVLDLEIRAFQTVTLEFLDAGGTIVDSTSRVGGLTWTLFDDLDFSHLTGITEIRAYDNGQTFRLDDINYHVAPSAVVIPLPTAAGIGLLGLGLVGVRRSR